MTGAAVPPAFVVCGCLTIDSVVGARGELIRNACGGNALYAAAGAHIWDRRVGLVARVGHGYPEACLASLAAAVDAEGIRRLATDHPIRVAFAYRPDGSRTRTIPPDALAAIPEGIRADFVDTTGTDGRYLEATPTSADIPAGWLAAADGFHLPALLEASLHELVAAIRRARPGALITVDAPWFARRDGTLSTDLAWLRGVDVVLPSEEDLVAFRPGIPIPTAARELSTLTRRGAVVKVGASGAIVADGQGILTHIPAFPADVVDPTGAGDSFCGGFLPGLRETGDLVEATVFGTVAASFVVEAAAAIPIFKVTREQAAERLRVVQAAIRLGIMGDEDWRTP